MDEINRCYKILKVNQNDSFRKVKRSYNSLMLKYHPSRPLGRSNREYFKDIILAFDLLNKLNKYSNDFSRSNKEIHKEWIDLDMPFAIEKADSYSKMKYRDFEKEFLPGCFTASKGISYLIFFIIASIAVVYPISAYKKGIISAFPLFYISIGFTIPLFILIYKTIVEENFITRRLLERIKVKYFLSTLQLRDKLHHSPIESEQNESKSNSKNLPIN